jgi:hypothetical protein
MDASVTLKLTAQELDTVREALKLAADASLEVAKSDGVSFKDKQDLKAAVQRFGDMAKTLA